MFVVQLNVVLPLLRDIVFREDGSDRTGRLASTTIDAFFRVDVEHRRWFEFWFVFLRMDAIHRASVNARSVLSADARFANDVCHRLSLWSVNAGLQKPNKNYTFDFSEINPSPLLLSEAFA